MEEMRGNKKKKKKKRGCVLNNGHQLFGIVYLLSSVVSLLELSFKQEKMVQSVLAVSLSGGRRALNTWLAFGHSSPGLFW